MGLADVNLNERYDLVLALTQSAVNGTLALYLHGQQKTTGLFYNVDESGQLHKAPDANSANFVFTGTLDYHLDSNGNPVDIVQLNSPTGPRNVIYNLTFSSASFEAKKDGVSIQQGPNDSAWVITFDVGLRWGASTPNLPAAVRAGIDATMSQAEPSLSAQFLYLDLNNARLDALKGITIPGNHDFAVSVLKDMMSAYLAEQQANGGVVFEYSPVAAASAQVPPTYPVTALDFVVSPYRDRGGATGQPELDTLCYLMMVNNRPLPTSRPSPFSFNFVDDSTEQGVIAIRRELHQNILLARFQPILKIISPVLNTIPNENNPNEFQILPGLDGNFSFSPIGGVLAVYLYRAPQANNSAPGFWKTVTAELDYSVELAITVSGAEVFLSATGTFTAREVINLEIFHTLPKTQYIWNVDLKLEMNSSNLGEVGYGIVDASFNKAPVVAPSDAAAFQVFVQTWPMFSTDPGGIRAAVQEYVQTRIAVPTPAGGNLAGSLVFPGGASFLFKNPEISPSGDLAANVTYKAPSGTH